MRVVKVTSGRGLGKKLIDYLLLIDGIYLAHGQLLVCLCQSEMYRKVLHHILILPSHCDSAWVKRSHCCIQVLSGKQEKRFISCFLHVAISSASAALLAPLRSRDSVDAGRHRLRGRGGVCRDARFHLSALLQWRERWRQWRGGDLWVVEEK